MANNLNIKTNTVAKFDGLTTKDANSLYFATDTGKVYIYKGELNVVPRLLGLANGGTGATFAAAAGNSVVTLNSSAEVMKAVPTAKGAFYSTGTNSTPKFGTLPVAEGGTGKTSFAVGALLVGNNGNAINLIADVDKGFILMSNGANTSPIYSKPSMKWTDGTSAGPVFHYLINGVDITGTAIPSANDTVSGVVTTGAQTFVGSKTFNNDINAVNIYPKDNSKTYNLGYWNSISDNKIWNTLHTQRFCLYDKNNYRVAYSEIIAGGASASEGTEGKAGNMTLFLGNNIAQSSTLNEGAGNSKGRIGFYGIGSGYTLLQSSNTTSNNYTVTIPPVTGTVVITTGTYSSTSDYAKRIPYFDTNSYTSVKHSNDFTFTHKDGDTSDTPGISRLTIGNSINVGKADNQKGTLRLYTASEKYVDIIPGSSSAFTTLYLPGINGQFVVHSNDAQVGSDTRLIYIAASGKVVASSKSIASSGKQLMYLNGGTLTASAADVGANNKFVYLSDGTLTESDSTIGSGIQPIFVHSGTFEPSSKTVANGKQLMYLDNGTLTASTTDVGEDGKPVYLKDGIITACTPESVFSNFSKTAGKTSGEVLSITVAGTSRSVTLDSASADQSGVVTTGAQSFGGNKTFTNILNAFGGTINIGSSGESVELKYDSSTDTLTMTFAS